MRIFIGSSGEQRPLVEWLTSFIHREYRGKLEPVPWTAPWKGGSYTLENLLNYVETTDACIIFWTPDDLTFYRDTSVYKPRDNLIFEAGLFFTAHGKERTQLMIPHLGDKSKELKVPTDVLGLTWNYYEWPDQADDWDLEATGLPLTARNVCKQLLDLGPRPWRASLLKNLSGLPDVEEVCAFIGRWPTINTQSIIRLIAREQVKKEIDILVIYRLDREIRRVLTDFVKKRKDAKLRVCFANMWDRELREIYKRKFPEYSDSYIKNAIIEGIQGLIGPCDIHEKEEVKKIIVSNVTDLPQAHYEIKLTGQRITYSYYRVDDIIFIIPLPMMITQNPSPLAWVIESGTAPNTFNYYKNEYDKVLEEAVVNVYPGG